MKSSNRFALLFCVIILVVLLIGCNKVEEQQSTSFSNESTEPTISSSEESKYRKLREEFDAAWQNLDNERDICLSEFLNNPMVTEEFLESLYANEAEYVKLFESAKKLSSTDYEEVYRLFNSAQIHDGIETIMYNKAVENLYFSYKNGKCVFKFQENIQILWTQNFEKTGENETESVYEIINTEEDAYILFNGRTGFWLVRFVSVYKEGVYTREMYDNFYNDLEKEKADILSEFARNPVITEEFLKDIYENEEGYKELLNSAKFLPKEEYSNIMLSIELGQIKDGITTVAYDKKYFQKYYRYEEGIFSIDSDLNMEVKWSQNIEDITEDELYGCIYKVKNPKEDAYLLLLRGEGYQLFRITGIKQNE